jgi:hypothetical protein
MEHDVVVDAVVVVVVVVVVAAAAAAAVVGCLEAVKPMASRRHTVVGAMYIYSTFGRSSSYILQQANLRRPK